MARRSWKFTLGLLIAGAAGSAAGQDFTAGKTPAQLFQSDCSACHKSPQGLSRGLDPRSLVGFLREHYTTKQESAGVLAAYVAAAGGGAQRPAAAAGQNPRPAAGLAEGEPGQKPGQKPRANAASAPEPRPGASEGPKPRPPRVVTAPTGPAAQPPDDEGETAIMREESARRAARTREGAKPAGIPVDPTAAKLKSYGEAGGSARETERLADPVKKGESKLESYATSGSPVPVATPEAPAPQAVTPEVANPQAAAPEVANPQAAIPQAAKDAPADGDTTNSVTVPAADAATPPAETAAVPAADAANPALPVEATSPPPKRKKSKKDAAATPASPADTAAPHSPRLPRRAAAPIIRPVPGNN